MNPKFLYLLALSFVLNSCVSSQIYDDLKNKYDALQVENRDLLSQLDNNESNDSAAVALLKSQLQELKAQNSRLAMDLEGAQNSYNRMKASYDALENNSSELLSQNLTQNRALLTELEAKEKALAAESERLNRLQQELAQKSDRIDQLEAVIAAKEAQMRSLKDAIQAALTSFEGNGLTIEQRDGKVYVSMENKLLFESGSWAVNARGRSAVEALSKVLANNPEIAVLIEGHTDNVPYSGSGNLTSNWDLSAKRATAIVGIMIQSSSMSEANITAAARGEFAPVATNDTSEGREANRRIEVILTPKLDQITQLLEQIDE
ncbi:MAG: OmpA family protein [Gilvibacter sp.]